MKHCHGSYSKKRKGRHLERRLVLSHIDPVRAGAIDQREIRDLLHLNHFYLLIVEVASPGLGVPKTGSLQMMAVLDGFLLGINSIDDLNSDRLVAPQWVNEDFPKWRKYFSKGQ